MKYLLAELKAFADLKSQIAKTEVHMWERLAQAFASASRMTSQKQEERAPNVTVVQQAPVSRYLTAAQAAKFLGISKSSLYVLRNKGVLKYVTIGTLPRYNIEDLEAIIKRNTKH